MMQINPTLLQMVRMKVASEAAQIKSAVVPPPPPMDPAMMGGAPPTGGAPPMDPAMMGGAPPMDPAMMGGAPPMDPSMAGGAAAPPVDPAAAGAVPPAAPAAPGAPAAAPPKLKPEDRINQVDYRLYNMQQQLTAIMNALNVDLPAGALITPPGSPIPVAEAAVPGGPQAPAQGTGEGGAPADASGIGTIEAMQAYDPASGGAAGGGESKQAADITELLTNIVGRGVNPDAFIKAAADPAILPAAQPAPPNTVDSRAMMYNQTAAAAALLRSRMRNA